MIKVKNFTRTFLAAPIDAAQTTISVVLGTGATFPQLIAGDYTFATLVHPITGLHEVVKIIDITGDVFTVLRAQDDSPALTFPIASELSIQWTKKQVADYTREQNAMTAVDPIILSNQEISLKVQPGVVPGAYGNVTVDVHGLITGIGAESVVGYATETTPGLSQIATGPEATAGLNATSFITPSTMAAFVAAFTSGSLNVAGNSMTLGNGAILKWGITPVFVADTMSNMYINHDITFPAAFPTACLAAIGSDMRTSLLTPSTFRTSMYCFSNVNAPGQYWLALGH